MPTTGKRHLLSRDKGYLSSAGPQYRFILFLFVVLGVYTVLLKVFQKLAEILQLPIFLTIALIILLLFVGVAGTMYSHTFVGPLRRIRGALEHLAVGDTNISLRLRDSDEPMLKDLVKTISRLCDTSRSTRDLIGETARDLFADIEALRQKAQQGADIGEIKKHIEGMRTKQDLLNNAIKSIEINK
jgi:methyl-accepting chemotaxis protein